MIAKLWGHVVQTRVWVWALLIFTLVLGLYRSNLNAPFELDDFSNIVGQPRVEVRDWSLDEAKRVFFGVEAGKRYIARAIPFLTFAFTYSQGGYRYSTWHWFNNALHALNAVLVFFLLLYLGRLSNFWLGDEQGAAIAFALTMVWAMNPLHVETVTYIVQRITLLAVTFMLCSCLSFLKFIEKKNNNWLIAAFCFWVLGCLSKEIALVTPMLWLCFWEFARPGKEGSFRSKRFWLVVIAAPILLAVLGYAIHGNAYDLIDRMLVKQSSIVERVATQFRVVWTYALMFLVPHGLTLDHQVRETTSLFPIICSIIGAIGIGIAITLAVKKARLFSLCSLGVFWFFGSLVLESSVVPLEPMFQHRAYLPSLGILMVILGYALPMWDRNETT